MRFAIATPVRPVIERFALALLAILALGAARVSAQSLEQAVEAAWRRDPQARLLDARRAELAARLESIEPLFAAPGALTLGARTDRLNRDQGDREYEVEVGAPVWLPRQRAASIAVVRGELDLLAARQSMLRNSVAASVRSAWIDLETARIDGALARELAATLVQLEGNVRRRLQAGDASRFDANLIQGERLAAEAAVLEAQVRVEQAELALRALTGLAQFGPYPEEPEALDVPPEHPRLAAARSAALLATAKLRGAEASTRGNPEVSLFLRRERGGVDEPYANSVGVKLRIPFSRAPQVREGIAAARAELDRDDAELRNAMLRLPLQVEQARQEFDAARTRQDIAESRRRLAEENLKLARKSYELGETDLAAYLRVRTTATEAERAVQHARLAQAAARGRLNQALGVVP
jgi:cobalt-zinc-cadmium efflux system outer membrane protein